MRLHTMLTAAALTPRQAPRPDKPTETIPQVGAAWLHMQTSCTQANVNLLIHVLSHIVYASLPC